MIFSFRFAAVSLALLVSARAQPSAVPVAVTSIPAQNVSTGASVSLDLRSYFTISGITGQVVQFDTVRGKFNAALLASDAPLTVANFLNYVNRGAYTNSFFHRSVPGFVIQGGGFTLSGSSISDVPRDPTVQNEFKVSNTRGTFAMAKVGGDPNSATTQWFINLADNGGGQPALDSQNGGFTVFARVLGSGMSVADTIAALPVVNATSTGPELTALPLLAVPVSPSTLVIVRSIKVVPLFPAASGDLSVATFGASSTSPAVATVAVSGSSLTVTGVSTGTSTVVVRATDVNGSFTENSLLVTVAVSSPVITGQPVAVNASAGQTVALTVSATGANLSYQWHRSSISAVLLGATGPTLILANISVADADGYFCRITNTAGSVQTTPAVVTVSAAGQLARLSNLSVRTNLTAGQPPLIVGFSTSGAKDLLIRGVGPKLADFGLPNFYVDPRLEIYDSAAVKKSENDNWSSSLTTTFASVGAFALNADSKDAALVASVTGGSTAQLKGTGSGVALVEVYDTNSSFSPRLSNVSARNFVGAGGDILIAGFTVVGPVAKTLLIRGVGPKLTSFGVSGTLADPKLELYRGATKLAENDNWVPTAALATPGFPLDPGSKDSVLLITLPPGGYTAQISGVNGGTGEALVEIYEVQ